MANILLFCKYRGFAGNSSFEFEYEDSFGPAYTAEELFWSCLDDCLPTYVRGQRSDSPRGLIVGCGSQSFEDFLAPNGILFHSLRRITRHGEHSVTAVDVGEGIGYDCFANGDKVKISDKAMSDVTVRDVVQNSDSQNVWSLIEPIFARREAICGGLLVDIRGEVNLQVVLLRSENSSKLFKRLVGVSGCGADTLTSLTSRAVRKGFVRVLHFVDFSETPQVSLLAEVRILRLKHGSCGKRHLQNLVSSHEIQSARLRREQLSREANLAQTCASLDALTQELTTAAKRVRKTRIAAEEARQRLLTELATIPSRDDSDDPHLMRLEANHKVVAEFWQLFQKVSPLHGRVLEAQRENLRILWRKRDRGSDSTLASISADVLSLIDDIVSFVCERSVMMAEGVVAKDESYAWFDIIGCSKRLRGPDTWFQPLKIQAHHVYPSVADLEYPEQTDLGSDNEEEAKCAPTKNATQTISPKLQTSGDPQSDKPPSSVALSPGGDPTQRKLNITIKHDTEEADKKYLMAVYDSTTLVQDVTKYLKAGTKMLKHGRIGSPHERLFWVAPVANKMTLLWVDPDKRNSSAKTTVPLSDVSSVILGPFSKVFKRHPVTNQAKEFFLSFSMHLKDDSRTVDIVAPTLPDFEAWVLGVCHMAQVDPRFGKKLKLTTDEFTDRLTPQERELCENWYIFPQSYVALKDRIVGLRDEVQQHLRLFGNNAEQAFIALGGIHLPQVNNKGAILMTKGELRHHCTPFNIDIFRVCEIWRTFNDQNLIYDLAFSPATDFSQKQRKGTATR